MTKPELHAFFKKLKDAYPDAVVKPDDWWEMFKNFEAKILYDGLQEWKEGQWGFRPPSVQDLRDTHQCCMWNPDGIFYKALLRTRDEEKQDKRVTDKTDEIQKEVMEELRHG